MKKLILTLIMGLLLSNISYGASISDLLGSKKGIKLACTIKEGEVNPSTRKKTTWSGEDGATIIYEIKGKNLFEDGAKICCGKERTYIDSMNKRRTEELIITENYYKYTYEGYKENSYVRTHQRYIEINRYTGSFVVNRNYYTDNVEPTLDAGSYVINKGICVKASENKL
jgi:hypothetical protein